MLSQLRPKFHKIRPKEICLFIDGCAAFSRVHMEADEVEVPKNLLKESSYI